MSDLEVQLDNIDEQLKGYSKPQRWFIYLASAIGIILIGWTLYLSDALSELNGLQEQRDGLLRQISENSPEAYQRRIAQTTEMIVQEEHRGESLKNEKEALLLEMSASHGLVFDNRHYAKMLDMLLERSVRLGLKIELMESEDANQTFYGKVAQFKTLTISGSGNFPAIADFLTFIESQNTLVQIQSVEIRSDETKPRFEAVVSYMGVKL